MIKFEQPHREDQFDIALEALRMMCEAKCPTLERLIPKRDCTPRDLLEAVSASSMLRIGPMQCGQQFGRFRGTSGPNAEIAKVKRLTLRGHSGVTGHFEIIHTPKPATKIHMMISPANTKPRMIADCLRL